MKLADGKEILGSGNSFVSWRLALQAKLGRKNVLGHVFDDIPGIRPLRIPADPTATNLDEDIPAQVVDTYVADLRRWSLGEIEAKNIFTQRLSSIMCLQHYTNLTAKQL